MKKDQTNKEMQTNPEDLSTELFSRSYIPWEKSKEEIWKDLSARIHEEGQITRQVRLSLSGKQWIAMAASIALLLAVAGFMRFYSVSAVTPPGVHSSVRLPDGSKVELNAESTLKYHPIWWRMARNVNLEGEAFFEVIPGSDFKVSSPWASTEVIGTSFNIFARESDYNVVCHSGKVKVFSRLSGENVLLTPNKRARMDKSGTLTIASVADQLDSPAWMNNLLMFASTPLRLVFDEIERQYGIVIVTPEGMLLSYSGNFALDESVDGVLTLLCRPFDLVYEKISGNTYTIYPSPVE